MYGKSYLHNGRKPMFDIATCKRIKARRDDGLTLVALAEMYGVRVDTIRNAIMRAEFAPKEVEHG